jgi:hypothetical protein
LGARVPVRQIADVYFGHGASPLLFFAVETNGTGSLPDSLWRRSSVILDAQFFRRQ